MAEKTVAMPDTHERATQPEGTRTRERYVTPPVDIYEMPEGLVVIADVPGVTPDHFEVHVDNHILTIRGQAAHGLPGEPTYREYELAHYFRQFELSAQVDESTDCGRPETRGVDAHTVQSGGSPAPHDCRGSQLTDGCPEQRHAAVPAQASRGLGAKTSMHETAPTQYPEGRRTSHKTY